MKAVIKLTKMANRLLGIRNKSKKGQLPRGGGIREKGSFDTLGRNEKKPNVLNILNVIYPN